MRKGRDGESGEKWKIMAEIVATNVVASRPPNGDRLQSRPLVPISVSMLNFWLTHKPHTCDLEMHLKHPGNNFETPRKYYWNTHQIF